MQNLVEFGDTYLRMRLYDGVYPGISLCTYIYYIEGTKYKILI
ncbi:unnamed protein product, partial [marine sediment metagenome]